MSRIAADSDNSLHAIIEAQIGCTAQLVDVLDTERSALLANDLDALEQAGHAKAMAAAHLQQLGERLAVQLGRAGNRAEVEAVLARQEGGGRLIERWRELGRLAALCNDANRANGTLLEAREKQVRGALAALQPEVVPAVYGRQGAQRAALPRQIISRA